MGTTFDEDMKLMLHCLFCEENGKSLSFLEGVLSGAERMSLCKYQVWCSEEKTANLLFFVGMTSSVDRKYMNKKNINYSIR